MVPIKLWEISKRTEVNALGGGVIGVELGLAFTGFSRRVCAIKEYAYDKGLN
jgi:hypothetical protein